MKIKKSLVARRAAVALTLLILPMSISAQDAAQLPRLRVATRMVQIGVIVRDKNGPVSNLTQNDFTVLDQGKPQKISIFSVESGASTSISAPVQVKQLPPNTFSNLPEYANAPRSITIVLLDDLNTLYGSSPESQYEKTPYWMEDLALQNAKNHLVEFLKELQPQDRVAIYGLSHSLHVLCDFTGNREQLLDIVKNYNARSVTNRAVVEPGRTIMNLGVDGTPFRQGENFENGERLTLAAGANEERAAETMAALQAIAAHVANIPGRKNLVWLTANLPFSGAAMARVLSPANIAVYPVDARGLLEHTMAADYMPGTADMDDLSGASGHMDNMPAQSTQPIGIVTMEKLADETGGQAFFNTNDLTGAIRKAVEDSAVTYTLGFYINDDSLDGKFHEIKIEVRGKGLTVRYPKGYFAFPVAATKNEDTNSLVAEADSPIESSAIPLKASVETVNQPLPHSLKVLCSIDAHHVHLVPDGTVRKGAVNVYIIEQDQTGKVLFNSGKTFNLQVPEKRYAALLNSGLLFHEYVQPKAGATTLRILVEDPSSAEVGSLIIPLAQIK